MFYILKMLNRQWEYVKVEISYWKYSCSVKGNLVKAYCKGRRKIFFLLILLSEEFFSFSFLVLFFKKQANKQKTKLISY